MAGHGGGTMGGQWHMWCQPSCSGPGAGAELGFGTRSSWPGSVGAEELSGVV